MIARLLVATMVVRILMAALYHWPKTAFVFWVLVVFALWH